jgi:hypothetical protein
LERKRRNRIGSLKKEDEGWVEDEEEKMQLFRGERGWH